MSAGIRPLHCGGEVRPGDKNIRHRRGRTGVGCGQSCEAKSEMSVRCEMAAVAANSSGREPRWRADGNEFFYLEASPNFGRIRLVAVPIGTGPNPVGAAKPLFEFKTLL